VWNCLPWNNNFWITSYIVSSFVNLDKMKGFSSHFLLVVNGLDIFSPAADIGKAWNALEGMASHRSPQLPPFPKMARASLTRCRWDPQTFQDKGDIFRKVEKFYWTSTGYQLSIGMPLSNWYPKAWGELSIMMVLDKSRPWNSRTNDDENKHNPWSFDDSLPKY